jgi:hypothetical protein
MGGGEGEGVAAMLTAAGSGFGGDGSAGGVGLQELRFAGHRQEGLYLTAVLQCVFCGLGLADVGFGSGGAGGAGGAGRQ